MTMTQKQRTRKNREEADRFMLEYDWVRETFTVMRKKMTHNCFSFASLPGSSLIIIPYSLDHSSNRDSNKDST